MSTWINRSYVYMNDYDGNFTIDMNAIMIESSTFVRNYVGLNGSILKIIGFPSVLLNSIVFSRNGNWNPDIFSLLS